MALVSMRQLLDHAAENSYGLPAFNVNNLEQMRAIMERPTKSTPPLSFKHPQAHANTQVPHSCAI